MFNVPEFSVGEFSVAIKRTVEDAFGYVRIKGEVTGFKRASSGHLYFSLKDDDGILSAVCFKNDAEAIDIEVADGLQIVASGRVTTFAGRSNYQIIVEKIEIAGIGAILAMIEKRRQKLAAEGLFDDIHKKEIPFFPRVIGVITSETGAVIQDIIHRVEWRCPTHLLVYGSAVQGKDAAKNVIAGVKFFNKNPRPDVIIIARGGGSFEDLLPFNDEELVRAIFASEVPIISAVGHETDTSLVDYVADLRAPTPSAAAELATPVLAELRSGLQYCEQRLLAAQERFFSDRKKQLENLQKYLIAPEVMLRRISEKFLELQKKLTISAQSFLAQKVQKLAAISLSTKPIFYQINFAEQKIQHLSSLAKSKVVAFCKNAEIQLENLDKLLQAGHYKKILQRGFALIKNQKGEIISSINNVKIKEEIAVEIADGEFYSYVLSCKKTASAKAINPSDSKQESLF